MSNNLEIIYNTSTETEIVNKKSQDSFMHTANDLAVFQGH